MVSESGAQGPRPSLARRYCIVFCASEAAPFAKTGGLGDVVGALPKVLSRMGHDVSVFCPLYRTVRSSAQLEDTRVRAKVPILNRLFEAEIWRSRLPGSEVPVYFVRNDEYYDRPGFYDENGSAYDDNCSRFVFFNRVILEALPRLNIVPDIMHCNDWHTALIPVYLKKVYKNLSPHYRARSVLTIHNLAYQGEFGHMDMPILGLGWDAFNPNELEFHGRLNFLKSGILFADALTTVSRYYARQILTSQEGMGLHEVLSYRRRALTGILNGIDEHAWDPSQDLIIAERYGPDNLSGKAVCKRALQVRLGLEQSDSTPLVGIVSRLAEEKGTGLIAEAFDWIMGLGVQVALLGNGSPRYHGFFEEMNHQYHGRVSCILGFDERLAHQIYAGADMFLMPSMTEPCGLSQMYALRYGTVPVVRRTGGLADTVRDYASPTSHAATGFTFDPFACEAMVEALQRAVRLYPDRPRWQRLMRNGMTEDFSWEKSALEYVKLYGKVLRG